MWVCAGLLIVGAFVSWYGLREPRRASSASASAAQPVGSTAGATEPPATAG